MDAVRDRLATAGCEAADTSIALGRALVGLIDDPSLTGWQRAALAEVPASELSLARFDEILRTEDTL